MRTVVAALLSSLLSRSAQAQAMKANLNEPALAGCYPQFRLINGGPATLFP